MESSSENVSASEDWEDEIRKSQRPSRRLVFKGRGDKLGTYSFFQSRIPDAP
jgi:hypothetical protein